MDLIGTAIIFLVLLFQAPGLPQQETVVLDVPFVETPDEVVDQMLKMARIDGSDILYDLGCGNGKIVIAAAKQYGIRGVGIDLNPARIRESVKAAEKAGVADKVRFYVQDIFEADFSEASILTLYLLERINRKLRPRILNALKPGTRVISHDFNMGRWKPDSTEIVHSDFDVHTLYLWIVPSNVAGTWDIDLKDDLHMPVIIEQEFQEFTGQALIGKDTLAVKNTHLNGNRIGFEVALEGDRIIRFGGHVNENRMNGKWQLNSPGKAETGLWSAVRRPGTIRPVGL